MPHPLTVKTVSAATSLQTAQNETPLPPYCNFYLLLHIPVGGMSKNDNYFCFRLNRLNYVTPDKRYLSLAPGASLVNNFFVYTQG